MAIQLDDHKKNIASFATTATKAMRQLAEKYELRKVKKKEESNSASVTYQNSTTAVEVGYEPIDRGVYTLLIRLQEGEIPPYPVFIHPSDTLDQFYLDDVISLRKDDIGTWHKKDCCDSGFSLDKQLSQVTSDLHRFAGDVLSGDFTVFSKLEEVVKKRSIELKSH